ncbi:hypothetical protein BDV96DRAFT_631684 [Lophiotrema nucula]|uniref:Uncharacterized protein n=1 Tax=Lophiotrema nucula TaxID=690887 RepID=A0A6A5ZBG7_9PLEO|nr:hypothetical protein BDV96DRAFT_631684 [Lophiotrema nucula]
MKLSSTFNFATLVTFAAARVTPPSNLTNTGVDNIKHHAFNPESKMTWVLRSPPKTTYGKKRNAKARISSTPPSYPTKQQPACNRCILLHGHQHSRRSIPNNEPPKRRPRIHRHRRLPQRPTPLSKAILGHAWLHWQQAARDASKPVTNLKYFVMAHITNDDTQAIIRRTLDAQTNVQDRALKPWPGAKFDVAGEAARALLGSPNGIAVGYMMLQHKAELRKYVRVGDSGFC